MKIYTAARYARREEILEQAKKLSAAGHIVTARWVQGDEEGKSLKDVAMMDYDDVFAANMVLVFTDPVGTAWTGGGRHTELGLGYALGKQIWLVGPREQVFHHLPDVKQFDNIDQVIGALSAEGDGGTIFKKTIKMSTESILDKADSMLAKGRELLAKVA